jgi:prophage DNA circulation protein
MAWRDRLVWFDEENQQRKKASFRGNSFFILDSDRSVGRRNVIHQYPFKDDPYIEDLGRDVDEFTINGYVIQNSDNEHDYIDERDALIKALREEGPGILIHPYYGELIVNLSNKARIEESFAQGGIARFTMSFVQAIEGVGLNTQVVQEEKDYVDIVDNEAENSLNMAKDSFFEAFDVSNISSYVQDSIMDSIDSLYDMMQLVTNLVKYASPSQVAKSLSYLGETYAGISVSTLSDICGFANAISGMFDGLNSIGGMYGEILSDQLLGHCSDIIYGDFSGPMSSTTIIPASLASGFEASTMEQSKKINENSGKTIVRAALEMARFGEETGTANPSIYGGTITPHTNTTYQRAKQAANLIAITNLARINAIITAIRTAVRIDYTSYDSTIEIMNEIISALESLLLKLGNDSADTGYDEYSITISSPGSYQAVENLRPVFTEAMIGIGASLAKIIDYKVPPVVFSSLVLAYDQYYDLNREAEIIKRNRTTITHPGFLPGGQLIEILNK